MTFIEFVPGRTSTSLNRRPTTSFSRSRRSTSISGSSGIPRTPLVSYCETIQRLGSGLLLGLFLAASGPRAVELFVHEDVRDETLVVVGPRRRDSVRRQLAGVPDRDLLEGGLGV